MLAAVVVHEALLRFLECRLARLLLTEDGGSPATGLGGGAAELVETVRCGGGGDHWLKMTALKADNEIFVFVAFFFMVDFFFICGDISL